MLEQKKIAVIGGSVLKPNVDIEQVKELGKEIARNGFTLLTGACPGFPQEAVKGAAEAKGTIIGVSPYSNKEEQIKADYPVKEFTSVEYTGLERARNYFLVKKADAVILVNGSKGTMTELGFALDQKKPIAVFTGTKGLADHIKEIIPFLELEEEPNVFYSSNAKELVEWIDKQLSK